MDGGVTMRDGAQLECCCLMKSPSALFWSFVLSLSSESSQPRDLLYSSVWKNTEWSLSATFVSWICSDKGSVRKKRGRAVIVGQNREGLRPFFFSRTEWAVQLGRWYNQPEFYGTLCFFAIPLFTPFPTPTPSKKIVILYIRNIIRRKI